MPDYEKLIERLKRAKRVAPASRTETVRSDSGRPVSRAVAQEYATVPVNPDGPEAAEAISTLLKERDALAHDLERSMARENELLNRT
jgi:hypothetical protein